jgi:hypothetical protein
MTAYKSCRLHKPASLSQIRFESHLAENLLGLLKAIQAGTYRPAPAKCFVVTHPKPREIFAADFQDRVMHHLVVSQLEPIWDRKFIHSSFACRNGRGTHGAIRYLQQKVRSVSHGGIHPVWCLQLDIEKFFVSIDRMILRDLLLKHARHPRLRELIQAIYGHDARSRVKKSSRPEMFRLIPAGKSWFEQGPGQGIPIGNLTSQFGANVILTALDHFVARTLKPSAYMRYMDDLLLLDRDPEKLRAMTAPIDAWLQANRKQRLNPAKTTLTNMTEGIRYLGYQLRQTDIPAEPLQAFPEPLKKWRLIQSLRKLEAGPVPFPKRPHWLAPLLTTPETKREIASVNSHMGSLVHANTFRFRKKSLGKFLERTREHKGIPRELADAWSPFDVKEGYRSIKIR